MENGCDSRQEKDEGKQRRRHNSKGAAPLNEAGPQISNENEMKYEI